jgi:hypothetical protein
VPYLFADCYGLLRPGREPGAPVAVDTRSRPYRGYLVAIAVVPMLGLFSGFTEIQRLYAIIGAWFFPVLAVVLLLFNGRRVWVGQEFRNGPAATLALAVVFGFFVWVFFQE